MWVWYAGQRLDMYVGEVEQCGLTYGVSMTD